MSLKAEQIHKMTLKIALDEEIVITVSDKLRYPGATCSKLERM